MRRDYLLRAYALVVGTGLFVLGLAGFTQIPFNTTAPENLLHVGVGLLFFFGGLLLAELSTLRWFVCGMGFMLLLGKVIIIATRRWLHEEWLSLPIVGIVCLVVGVLSVLLALLVGSGAATKEEE